MYSIIKSVIENGNFELASILKKIDTMWVQGNLTDDERAELVALAQGKANAQYSIDVLKKLEELDKRMNVVEKKLATDEPTEDTTTETTYADYERDKWYYNGDIVRFDDVLYICTAPDGVVCVWSPSEYPAYWKVAEV